jgi:phosphatidylserine/phosphatidylglycerophosphate/cardiolipin synthase-like enzyme
MRATAQGSLLTCRAIAGTHVVALAWTPNDDKAASLGELLGFAIERSELNGQTVVERYWAKAIKRFQGKDLGLAPGTPVSTAEHPVQSFQWGDYTVKPGVRYRYRVVPVRGKPKLIQLDTASSTSVTVTTEPTRATDAGVSGARHDIHFNRGVIGSQAYARTFQNAVPNPQDPTSDKMVWLSRGLFEALIAFIGNAKNSTFGLRAAFYEFRYQPVANALAKVAEAGADVQIVYDAESSYKDDNIATIGNANLDELATMFPRTVSEGIRHNKFIVLLKDGKPIAVWTGSTNISDGGIFGHSNVGHAVWDEAIAQSYADYWKRLADNTTPGKLRTPNSNATPLPAKKPAANSITPVFSARDDPKHDSPSLQWYADRMAEAKRIVCFTVAFNLDKVFQTVLAKESNVLRYVVKDDDLGDGEIIGKDHDVLFAAGGKLEFGALKNFLGERDNPLNRNDYIHTKFMLVDPLGNDPIVVTGSANFSQPSQTRNDENMLVIRGDTRVSDIYFGEFMRIFDHHYARYLVKKIEAAGTGDPNAGYLKEKLSDWLPAHFDPKSYKSKRRKYFVEDN